MHQMALIHHVLPTLLDSLCHTIVFGLLFSTLLTLLVTPSALMLKSKYLTNSSKKFDKVGKQTQ